jgi:hypothetical protein
VPLLPTQSGGTVHEEHPPELGPRAGVQKRVEPGRKGLPASPLLSCASRATPSTISSSSSSNSSTSARNRSRLSAKWWYRAPRVTPARRTNASVETPEYPRRQTARAPPRARPSASPPAAPPGCAAPLLVCLRTYSMYINTVRRNVKPGALGRRLRGRRVGPCRIYLSLVRGISSRS